MKYIITEETEREDHLLVEAIFEGFHIRWMHSGLEIIGNYTEDEFKYIYNVLKQAKPFPIYHLDKWAKNLVKIIEKDPNSKIIQCNSFEYAPGVRPMSF